jgi:hypothetical protein
LFGKPSVFGYPQRKLRLARFKGTDKSEFLDNRQPEGPEFDEIAGSFVARFRPKTGSINPKLTGPIGTGSAPSGHQITPQVTRRRGRGRGN